MDFLLDGRAPPTVHAATAGHLPAEPIPPCTPRIGSRRRTRLRCYRYRRPPCTAPALAAYTASRLCCFETEAGALLPSVIPCRGRHQRTAPTDPPSRPPVPRSHPPFSLAAAARLLFLWIYRSEICTTRSSICWLLGTAEMVNVKEADNL